MRQHKQLSHQQRLLIQKVNTRLRKGYRWQDIADELGFKLPTLRSRIERTALLDGDQYIPIDRVNIHTHTTGAAA